MSKAMRYQEEEICIPELEALVGKCIYSFWTEKDIEVLKKYYGKVKTKEIARYLNRPVGAVGNQARKLGLTFATPLKEER